jgi:glycine C-acetyltransferase
MLKKAMDDLGFNTGFSETPIIPIIVGESEKAKRMSNRLFEEGVFALPIVFPMVARDQARLRLIMNAALTKDDLEEAIAAFEKVGKELKII